MRNGSADETVLVLVNNSDHPAVGRVEARSHPVRQDGRLVHRTLPEAAEAEDLRSGETVSLDRGPEGLGLSLPAYGTQVLRFDITPTD